MLIRLELPLIPISRNSLDSMHWRARHRAAREWAEAVMVAKAQAKAWGPAMTRCKVMIEISHTGHGILDEDNLWGGLKYLFDALVKNGLITDDNDQVIIERGLLRIRVASKNQHRTIVKITAVN